MESNDIDYNIFIAKLSLVLSSLCIYQRSVALNELNPVYAKTLYLCTAYEHLVELVDLLHLEFPDKVVRKNELIKYKFDITEKCYGLDKNSME